MAVRRVRAVALRQAGRAPRRGRRWLGWRLPGPSLDYNPVLWREWHRKRPSFWSRLAWFLYGAMALLLSLFAIKEDLGGRRHSEWTAVVNALQVPIGLLLLSVGSSTSLTEERVRGSLDVLLTTPLTTLTILQGKWWGAFRPVLLLAVLPGLVAAAMAGSSGAWGGVVLLVGLVLAYGAALTSLGLALAVWVAHPGRAQAVSVVLFVLVLLGPMLAAVLSYHRSMEFIVLASPLIGMGTLTDRIIRPDNWRNTEFFAWHCVWLVVYLGAAFVFFVFSWLSFDRCLGRVGPLSAGTEDGTIRLSSRTAR